MDGQIVNHAGAWLAGDDDARAGLIMPAQPRIGMRYFQEIAPDLATFQSVCESTGGVRYWLIGWVNP